MSKVFGAAVADKVK